jgi:hypothetical protein
VIDMGIVRRRKVGQGPAGQADRRHPRRGRRRRGALDPVTERPGQRLLASTAAPRRPGGTGDGQDGVLAVSARPP